MDKIWYGLIWAMLALLPPLLGLLRMPALTRAVLGDLRFPRVLYYWVLGLLGWALANAGLENLGKIEQVILDGAHGLAALMVCLTYAAVFAIVSNNIEDLEADRISNPGRPLVQGRVEVNAYWRVGLLCQGMALLLAALWGWEMLAGVAGISLGYWVYSCNPLKLKRFVVLAKFVLGFNSWWVALCGFALAGGDILHFPLQWSVFILVPLGLAANFIDLKDTAGDRAAGIKTLPVLLGEGNARHIIAASTVLTYAIGNYLLDYRWAWIPGILACIFHVYSLYRKPYNEKLVFLSLLVTLSGLVFFLLFKQILPP